jgi:hypothetical protein
VSSYRRYIVLVLLLFLVLPPAYYYLAGPGLDASYFIGIHLAHTYHLVFGKDIVFTFGPLAILNERYPIGVNRWVFLLFDGYFLASLWIALKAALPGRPGYGPVVYLFAGFLLALSEPVFQWYFVLFAFYLFFFFKEPSAVLPIVQTGLLSLLCLFYKVNLGITAFVLCIAAIHYVVFRRKISLLRYVVILCSYLAALLISAQVLRVDLKGYIAGSLELIDAYSDAMSLPAGHYTLFLIGALLIFLLVAYRCVRLMPFAWRKQGRQKQGGRVDENELIGYGSAAILVFVLYKSGFVRMDHYHISHFFHIAGLIPAGLFVFARSGPSRKWAAVCSWIILGICIVTSNTIPGVEHPYFSSDLLQRISIAKIGAYYKGIQDFDRASSDRQVTPNALRTIIGDHPADIIPTEISKIQSAGLRYDPRPVIQSYSAYNTYLDSLNSQKYLSPGAPDYILFSLSSIDHRYAFFDEARTKMAIFSHYHVAGEADGELILQKKALNPLRQETEAGTVGQLGMDIALNDKYDLQFSRIFARYNLWGRAKRFLYQPPALHITFFLDNGDSVSYPAAPTILEDGILLNKYVDSRDDFQLLMQSGGRSGATIKKMRIDEDADNGGFAQDIRIVNTYYSFPARPEPERVEDSLGVAAIIRKYDSYRPLPVDLSKCEPDDFGCRIETVRAYSPEIRIQGWAFREMPRAGRTIEKVILRKADTAYALRAEKFSREGMPMLSDHLAGGGFVARVSRSWLAAGAYRIGIVIADTLNRRAWIRYADRQLMIR